MSRKSGEQVILVRPFCSYTQVVTDLVEEIDGFMTQRALHFPAAPKFHEPEGTLGPTEAREMTRRPYSDVRSKA